MRMELPQAPPFMQAEISIHVAPTEPQKILFRDVIESVDFLWGNPTFREHMDYAPAEVFGAESEGRIYYEMCEIGRAHV